MFEDYITGKTFIVNSKRVQAVVIEAKAMDIWGPTATDCSYPWLEIAEGQREPEELTSVSWRVVEICVL